MSGSGDAAGGQGPPQPKTSDFIGFSIDTQGSPSGNKFTPANYSSPQGNQQQQPFFQNNRQWSNKKFNNYNNSHNNFNGYNSYNNYNSPNRSFNNRSFNSSHNRSPNSSFQPSNNRSFNNSGHFKSRQDHNNTFNKHVFLHPSFMEDPWAELEMKLNQSINQSQLET